jgi:hypothetical protein
MIQSNLQRRTLTLQSTEKNCFYYITWKSKTKAFLEQNPVGCKAVVDNKCLRQVKNFKYLGCGIFYENKKKCSTKL